MVRGNGRKKKRPTKKEVQPKSSARTIGVRFLTGNHIEKIYTYQLRKGVKVHLGQELVADTPRGSVTCAVVRIDSTPQLDIVNDDGDTVEVKFIERKVVPL